MTLSRRREASPSQASSMRRRSTTIIAEGDRPVSPVRSRAPRSSTPAEAMNALGAIASDARAVIIDMTVVTVMDATLQAP